MLKDEFKNINWEKINGLIPVIIQCNKTGKVLMHAYMNEAALDQTIKTKKATFFSRTKQRLWTKGETSHHYLNVIDIRLDCDHDTLLILANAEGPTCHKNTISCFDNNHQSTQHGLFDLSHDLTQIIHARKQTKNSKSYIYKLTQQGLPRIAQKVGEEAVEVVIEAMKLSEVQTNTINDHLKNETADLLFHLLILLEHFNLGLEDILEILNKRRFLNS